ncbi:probable glycosyltransferase At5g03795 [Carica papaya]|uniref:probable glycosyltransferase At5g03795 n=1 Tax=Carica papaya TaxID=3649 RepID=UPI000B8D02E1|nr:probable glycosyltransferase At5g03795 [Carica papaya]
MNSNHLQMGDHSYSRFACLSCSSSSSVKLLIFMAPFIVLLGFVFVLDPTKLNYLPVSTSLHSSSASATNYGAKDSDDGVVVELGASGLVMIEDHRTAEAEGLNSSEASVVNQTSSSLLPAVDDDQDRQLTDTKTERNKEETTVTTNGTSSPTDSLLNESHANPMKPNRETVRTSLQRLEAGLQRARAAIKEASISGYHPLEDPDYVPIGPIYRDAKAFHRSYLEMEKQFKIYVYKEGEPPLFHDGPCRSIYSMEGNFIHKIETNKQFRTNNPEKAHVFYLPFSIVKMVRFVYDRNSRDFAPIKNTVVDYINLVAGRYPYWNRSLGSDHLMLSCHDWGPEASFSHPYLFKNSIRALCNANTSEKFNPTKDVSIPEINLQTGELTGLLGGPSPSRRPILAFFAGGVHGPIRPVLLEHWEDKDEDIKVHKYLPKGVSYHDMMRNSKFCICPSGYEVASPRIVEALYSGCVPVLISVDYVPPFNDVLNWKSFSVEVSVEDIPNLKKILLGISSRQYIRMHRRVLLVRRHFEFNSPPKRFDVFHMILHSVWLRRLNVRVLGG